VFVCFCLLGQVERTAFPRCRATFPAPILVNDRYFFAHARTESPTPIESLPAITLKLADLTLQFTRNIHILISHAIIGPNYTEVALVATIAIPTSAISPVALRKPRTGSRSAISLRMSYEILHDALITTQELGRKL